MGFFNFFKKQKEAYKPSEKSEVQGPTFLEGLTKPVIDKHKVAVFEWYRQLVSSSGNTKFRVRYYGQPHDDYDGLIIQTEFAPALVYAETEDANEIILLFDGCRHGYNAMFCDTYTKEQKDDRKPHQLYKDADGNEIFEIKLSAYYQFSEEEFADMVDADGYAALVDGTKVSAETAWRNCYDVFSVLLTNIEGRKIEIISEELA